jgi:hypothetical protein
VKVAAALLAASLAIVLGACSNMSGDLRHEMQQWAQGADYATSNAQLQEDFTNLAAGVRLQDLKGLRTECAGFGVDAETLDGQLPTPSESVTNDLDKALQLFYNASVSCYAMNAFSSARFHQYEQLLAKGKVEYKRAQSELLADGVR